MVACATDEDVGGHDGVGHGGDNHAAVVEQVDGDVDGVARHGHEKNVFETTGRGLGLGIGEPLLEERGEGVAIDDRLGAVVAHGDLSVALHRQFGQPLSFAVPTGRRREGVKGNGLMVGITREGVVDA